VASIKLVDKLFDLSGKVAVVAGGKGGIGPALKAHNVACQPDARGFGTAQKDTAKTGNNCRVSQLRTIAAWAGLARSSRRLISSRKMPWAGINSQTNHAF